MKGAVGGYDNLNGLIYLSSEFVAVNQYNPDAIAGVILEEIGHFIDSRVNVIDSPGDEGELFSSLVRGIKLSDEQLNGILSEDDFITTSINGQDIIIEQSNPDQAGDNFAQARDLGTITGTNSFQDSVSSSDRLDFYKFNLDSSGTVRFGLTGLSADANIVMFNSARQVIAGSGKSGTSDEFRIVRDLQPGDYYIRVVQKSGNTDYDFSLDFDEAGDNFAQARDLGTITGTNSFQDSVSSSDRLDFYKFNLDSSGTIRFGLTGLSADANIVMLNSERQVIAGSGKSGTSDELRIIKDVQPGDYYIRVVQKSGATNYDFSLDFDAEIINLTSFNEGESVEPGENLEITWNDNIDENVKIDLLIQSNNGTSVQTIEESTPSNGSYQWTVPEDLATDAEYKIRVSSISNSSVTDTSNNFFTVKDNSISSQTVADFDRDGDVDLLLRNQETGLMRLWILNDTKWAYGTNILEQPLPFEWELQTEEGNRRKKAIDDDFNGDGQGSGSGYYTELAGLSDDEWDIQSGDDNQFRSDSPYGGGDQRWKTDDRIEQIYTDLSNVIFGTRYHMTAGYAYDQSYYNGFGLWHAGIDIGAPAGTSVKAVLGGTVAWISAPGTNNSFIGINSDDGRQWVYGHVGNLNVSQGQRVNAGDNIAKIGHQNHLHLEVENGHAYAGIVMVMSVETKGMMKKTK